jgi:hypothetical protein
MRRPSGLPVAAVVVGRNSRHADSAQPSIKDAANARLTAGIIDSFFAVNAGS